MVDLKGKTLYEALGVAKDASQAEIRKAFHKLALALHPDKNPGDAGAVDKFQTLQKVYGILSDPEKRKVYDQTGSVDDAEELAGEQFNALYEYYRSLYAPVTENDLDAFHEQYRGGAEERADLLRYYRQFQGDMGKVFEWLMCSDEAEDSHRFMEVLDAAVAAKEAPRFAKYTAWAKAVAARPRPKPGAAKAKRSKGGKGGGGKGDEAALVAAIRGRQQGGGALARLAGGGGVLGSLLAQMGGDMGDMPSEEDFEAARQRLEQRGKKGGGGGKKAGAGGKQKAADAGGSGGKRAKK